jgi:phage terminase large subunit GpA-like protein
MALRPGRIAQEFAIAISLFAMALFYGLRPPACEAWMPRPEVRTVEWASKFISLPPGSEIQGKFRIDLFPHMEEPLDCCDDPRYERVSVQASSRNGKTVSGQVLIAKTAACNPHPMAFGDADERSTRRVISRTWEILERCEPLIPKLPPKSRRSDDHIQLADCIVHGAWSGSAATAADFAAFLVILNEIDKATKKVSDEADFVHLLAERAKGYRRATIFSFSTPSLKGKSRIEALRLAGDNRGRYVACPFCNHFQVLRLGDLSHRGGLRWDRDSNGKSSPTIAFETAYYECEKCFRKILDEHRYALMNSGIYVKEGQEIKRGKVVGKAVREGRHASFGPISTLYSLLPSITWGSIAREFLESHLQAKAGNRERLRNFVNSWLGETWDPRPKRVEIHELTKRLGTQEPKERCPAWAVFCTRAADVAGDFEEFPWQTCAWGPQMRGAVIDYGVARGEKELESLSRDKPTYPHADGGAPVRVAINGLDTGSSTTNGYAFCGRVPNWVPLKGLTGKFQDFVKLSPIVGQPEDRGKLRKAAAGFSGIRGSRILWEINHERTQCWIQDILDGNVNASHAHFFTLCQEASLDYGGFLQHLVNEFPAEEYNDAGYLLHEWQRTGPNEQRDLARYCRALASVVMQFEQGWGSIKRIPVEVTASRVPPAADFRMPDGREYFVLDRR